ncbi:hypothetical protein BKA57DRAFT_465159 [Linnemannia elongata]|nr:hypothetical protein BKA57DRAFT_465159 [Linnemannia elongata]
MARVTVATLFFHTFCGLILRLYFSVNTGEKERQMTQWFSNRLFCRSNTKEKTKNLIRTRLKNSVSSKASIVLSLPFFELQCVPSLVRLAN